MGKANWLAITLGKMTPEQIEQLRFALSQPRYADWPAPPIVPGNWRDLDGDLAINTVIAICEWLEDERNIRNLSVDWSIDRARVRPLTCYEDTMLVELGGHAGFGRPGLMNIIVHEDGMALLDGTSTVIHDLNLEFPPLLDTADQRREYLHLFMNWVHADNGRFQPVATQADLQRRLFTGDDTSFENMTLSAFEETVPPEGSDALAHYTGTVLYGTSLFQGVMAVYRGGIVEMIDDVELMAGLPVREESLVGPMIINRI